MYCDSGGTDKKNDGQMMNFKNKKDTSSNEQKLIQTQHTMKKINVLRDGQTRVQEVKMTAKQIRDYVAKVRDSLFEMSIKWDFQTCYNHNDPTYFGILKATEHTENVLNTEAEIPMIFAFTKPEQCAIYLAFCFGAFDCIHFAELTTTTTQAAAMIKVLTSKAARAEVLGSC